VRIGKDFGLKNSVFYIRTVLTENNRFLCIFSFTVFIVNEYFTTVTKLKICAHHLLLTIILNILKCVTLYPVLFNDEDFHSVEILETVVRQSEVLALRKKWLFCKVTTVSIQAFVEGLLRLANVMGATNGTLKNVNNICTLAINSTKYFVLFSGDLTGIR
jgi:hypothetical protein